MTYNFVSDTLDRTTGTALATIALKTMASPGTASATAATKTIVSIKEKLRTEYGVRVLLVSSDVQTVDTLCEFMGKMAMDVEVCSDFGCAADKLCHSKFEALVVDFTERSEALDLLKKSRQVTSHRAAVALAILNNNDEMPIAFRAGASFVLVKPLSTTLLIRTLRVGYPLMVNEKRRSFRCPVQIPVYVSVGSKAEFMATSIDISESGIALTSSLPLQVGDRVTLRLTLPHAESAAKINADVCWCDPAGSSGMMFVGLPAKVKEQLASLARRPPGRIPARKSLS